LKTYRTILEIYGPIFFMQMRHEIQNPRSPISIQGQLMSFMVPCLQIQWWRNKGYSPRFFTPDTTCTVVRTVIHVFLLIPPGLNFETACVWFGAH